MRETVFLGLALLVMMALLASLAQRLRIPTPIFLVLGGIVISLLPGVPHLSIDPDLIFLVFLPPLLYEAAWFMSWRELWRWRRIVLVLAFGLVVLTATAVAYTAQWLIPGFTLVLGFVLGGIISPPDAVAATSVLRNVNVPKSTLSILEGESLINDAASLIVLRFALASVATGTVIWKQVAVSFVTVTGLGAVVGLAIAGVFYVIHRWVPLQPRISILLTFLTPYLMYLAAEELHYSGVIAVVSGGLFLSNHSHRLLQHTERVQGSAMWGTIIFIINGLVFVLIGLELPVILDGLNEYSLPAAIGYGLAISTVVILVRLGFTLLSAPFTRLVGRYIPVAVRNVGWRGPVVVGWAGMRGVVSLAAAFSVPLTLASGEAFPHRSLLLFITFIVILMTLVVQGLTLPLVVRLVHPEEPIDRLPEKQQEAAIVRKLHEVAMHEFTRHYADQLTGNPLLAGLKNRLESGHLVNELTASTTADDLLDNYQAALVRLNQAKRNELMRLHREADFDQDILRKIEAQLDLEEEKVDPLSR
ncbi:Na+/H+ antiporter [Fibrella aquatilis]|uniref:Na+/H+ antiporter n=1 Tax=Fibrella aquatilis TaxID=2817059 RepID=A0A939JY89_9BACT|nr:Na+/H+ antiporter [Fibrella aquatilis]MBO0929621.1 Na+/H+ antiporter [Fibrella aquatilis]